MNPLLHPIEESSLWVDLYSLIMVVELDLEYPKTTEVGTTATRIVLPKNKHLNCGPHVLEILQITRPFTNPAIF